MAIQAQMADGRVLEFPDGTDTAVIQSTVQRLISAAGPDKQPSLGSPMGEDFGSSIMAAAQPKRESVLQGIEMPAPAAAPLVKPQFIDALQANLNALPEAERTAKLEQFKQRPDVYGKAANVIAQRYADQDLGVSPALQKLTDLRLEPQVQRFMEQGMEPEAAKNLAAQQAMMGRARPDLQQMNVDVAGEQAKAEAERVAQEMKDAGFITRVGAEAKGQATQTGLGLMSMYVDLTGDKDMQSKISGATRIQEEAGKAIPKGEGIAEKAAQQALASAAVQAPIMLLGTLTGTSAPILLQAGIQSLGSSYSEGRQAGLSPEMAMGRAAPMAAAEVLFERFGMTKALGGLKRYMNQAAKDGVEITGNDIARYFGKAIASEIPSEMETTLAQYGIDVLPGIGLNKNPSVEDLYKQLEETLRQTVIQSGAMAGAGAGVVKGAQAISSRLPQRRQSYEQDTSIAGTAEQMARERGFLTPEQRVKPPVVPSTSAAPTTGRIEPTFEPEALEVIAPPKEPGLEVTDLAKQRAEEQKSVLDLEQELEVPALEENVSATPPKENPVTEPVAREGVQPATEEEAKQTQFPGRITVEAPIDQLQLSEDVPQFKTDANKEGVVEPLGGKFERTGVAPIQVWRRTDGRMEIISGRHRFDLAKRSGEKTIPAQIHNESDGFTKDMAAVLDAELNIRDGQGKVKDYVNYFKGTGLDQDTAESRGLLARSTGKRAFTISNQGGDELIAGVRSDKVGDEAAYLIALNAPNDSRLQSVGIKAIQEGKSAAAAVNLMQAVKALAQESDTTTDMFGFDESAMKEAEEMAKIAASKQREMQTRLSAITGAAKNPALAKAEGIDIRDPEAVKRRIDELRQLKASWDNWSTNPDLIAEIRAARGTPIPKAQSIKLESPTEQDVADQEERKANAEKLDEQEQIRKESEAGADQFKLTQEEGRQDATGNLFEQPLAEPEIVAISPEQERKEALEQFERQLKVPVLPFYAQSAGKTQLLRPVPLTNLQIKELINLASQAIDLGMPASVLGNVTAAGSTRKKSAAAMSETGQLLIGLQWKTASTAQKLQVLIHELGHSIDFKSGKISKKADWSKAHTELKNWYTGSANKFTHPLAYPFLPKFKGKVDYEMESFAEAFNYYFTSPADLQKNAPEAYSQIQAIVERIQDGSQKAREAGATETGTAGINVYPARNTKNAEVRPAARAVGAAVSGTEGREDRGVREVNAKDISTGPVVNEEKKRNPSLKRKLDKLNRDREGGKITDEAFIEGVDTALEDADKARMYAQRPPRTRGADFIRQRLLEAKRRGDLSEEAVDFAEWFIQRNPQLVDDLGVSIRAPKESGVAGQYFDYGRLMALMKKTAKDDTVVHEILHHLERMMPPDMQNAIRKAWSQEFGKATQRTTNKAQKDFFKLLGKYHWHGEGREVDFETAVQMVKDGQVPSDFYQYVNPSEFWAVNGTDIMKGRFDAVRGGVLARLKNWLKELGKKIKSMVGMGSQGELIKALDSLSKSDGKFQSKEMLGESSTYASVGKTIFNKRPLVNWTTPDQTGMDQLIKLMQNKHIDTKRVIDAIESTTGQIEDRWNPYLMEENFHGRTAKQTKDFTNHELKPLFNDMREFGVSMDEFEEYLHNRHAQERNEQIAQVNINMPDKGSGIETADAQKYLTSIPADKLAKYKKLAKMVDSITSNTRQLLVDSGLESEETIQKWEDTYKHYIPLNRDDVDYSSNHGMSVGQGYSVKGTASRRATGSERAVVDILANIAMQRERNIVRAEKNRVATALYGLALKNSNPKFWLAVNPDAKKNIGATVNELVDMGFMPSDVRKLMEEPRKKEIDPRTGLVTEVIHQIGRGADNVMALRVNGENRFVFFNQNNDRANSMVRALKNLDADQLGTIMSGMALATRYIASINTQYNPVFGALNFARDVQGAVLQLSTTPIAGEQKAVMLNVMPAMMGIYKDLRLERDGKIGRGQWSRLWEEFQQHGGQTGFRDQFSRAEERGIALQRIIDPTSWTQSKMGKVFSANGTLTVPIEVARKTAAPIFNWLSDYNETMENSVRLAAYKVALDKGFSKDRAASIAKNLTVNFNRKGDIATQAGAMYAFFNASVQGTTRLAQTLAGPAGAAIVGGGLLLGTIEAVLMHMAGFGDDDPPDFVKEKNLIIPTFNGGKYVAIPLALGYNVIPNFSRLLTEATMRYLDGRPVKAADTTFKVLESLMGAFNPIGNAGWSFQTFAPTVADPFVALGENKDWTGKKIAREDFNSLHPTPGYLRAKESASTFGRVTSKWINSMSGGTEDTKGKFSPTPDQIDYLVGQATGGVGREGMKIERFIKSKMTGEELPSHSVPVFGRFYGDTKESSSVANQFYQNLIKMNEYEDTVKGMAHRKENVGQFLKENPEAVLYKMADQVERNVQKLRKLRHNQVEKEASKEVVKGTEKLITKQMMILNDQIEKLEKQRANK